MSWKRSPSSAIAVLTIPLLLCLPQTLVAALSVYDYVPSSLRSGWLRGGVGGGSLVRRNGGPELGYYDPLDYGGYLLTVSSSPFLPGFGFLAAGADCVLRCWCSRSCPGLVSCRVVADSTFLQSGRLGLGSP